MIALLMVSLLALTVIPAARPAEAVVLDLHATVEGPTQVAINEKHLYYVNVTGGHGADPGGNFSYFAEVISPSGTDATVSPVNGVNASGTFVITITMPSKPGDITLRTNVSGYSSLGTDLQTKLNIISVVSPIVLSAKVVNQGSVPLTKVPIVFYLDGSKVYNTTFDLAAGASRTIVFNVTNPVSSGQHVVRVELDPNNQFVRFAGGGTVFTQTVYVNPPDYGSTDGLLILLFIMLILVTYLIYKRPKRRKKST
ncbi:MAG: hypothetical protein LUO79_00480 [Methanomassiliicoccales archaeon]|nr:hypothetical protein [Methanomassiliicoccales archaeon]